MNCPGANPLFIGSLPFKNHEEALDYVLKRCPESPSWVQLPVHPQEAFAIQFLEGLPGLRSTPSSFVENEGPSFEEELLAFYERYVALVEGRESLEGWPFEISPRAAPGLYKLLEATRGKRPRFLKGQISGPMSVLVSLQDSSGRLAYYDERVRDAAVKLISMKAGWQTRRLRETGSLPIVFVDEPVLGHVGSSALIGVDLMRALDDLKEIFSWIRSEGGWPGLHVCANADWGNLLGIPELKVLSFDAYSYFDRFVLFKEEIHGFLRRGGVIAWGIVPTEAQALESASVQQLVERWLVQAGQICFEEIDLRVLARNSFLTPSCGLGSLDELHALMAMDLTEGLSKELRRLLL